MSVKNILLNSPLRPLWDAFKRLYGVDRKRNKAFFAYDEARFWQNAGAWRRTKEAYLAKIVVSYHVIEKGLTMPNRRLGFGVGVLTDLMKQIDGFVAKYGMEEGQLLHAIGVVKSYTLLHRDNGYDFGREKSFADALMVFCKRYGKVPTAVELHLTREAFYNGRNADFPVFAAARHTVRHYDPSRRVPLDKIERAVALAQTAPSACNRQHGRCYCLTNKETCRRVLELQGGNWGFGHLADKVLLVAADLQDIVLPRERNDAFVNGGIFLMNLCYALYYEEVAHCILTWAQDPQKDVLLRKLVPLKEAEVVVALLCCGEAPDEFDIAASPRRNVESVLTIV